MMSSILTKFIEHRVAKYFNFRQHVIVPNLSWGITHGGGHGHEMDLAVITKSGYLYEIEIKISKSDLKKDLEKKHHHQSDKVSRLFFAIPDYLVKSSELIPLNAGIITVRYDKALIIRNSKVQDVQKLTDKEIMNICRLGNMRIWGMREKEINKNMDTIKSLLVGGR